MERFLAVIGFGVVVFLSFKGIQNVMKEKEEELKEARDEGYRSASKA